MSKEPSGSIPAGQSIRTKILLLVGGILFFFLLITGYSIVSLLAARQPGNAASDAGGEPAFTEKQLAELLVESKRNADEFIQRHTAESVLQFRSATARIDELGGRLGELAARRNDEAAARKSRNVVNLARKYDAAFQQLVRNWEARGANEDEGLRERLRSARSRMEELCGNEESAAVDEALARIAATQEKYLNGNTPDTLQALEAAVLDLEKVAGETALAGEQQQMLDKTVKAYQTALDRHLAVSLSAGDSSLEAVLARARQKKAGALREAGRQLQQTAVQLFPYRFAPLLESVRGHEQTYLQQAEARDAESVRAALEQLNTEILAGSMPDERKTALQQAVQLYRDAFEAIVDQDRAIGNLVTAVNQFHAQLEQLLQGRDADTSQGKLLQWRLLTVPPLFVILGIGGAALAVVLIGILAAMRLAGSISTPILRMGDTLRRLRAEPDASAPDLPITRKDELGILARELNTFLQENPAAEQAGVVATSLEKTLQEHNTRITRMAAEQARILDRITAIAAETGRLCADTATDAGDIIDRLKELRRTVENKADASAPADDDVLPASEPSSRLQGILKAYAELAEDAGILALNAAIKAERAGPGGREFTMVANDLDKLARRTKDAAGELSLLLQDVSSRPEIPSDVEKDCQAILNTLADALSSRAGSLEEVAQRIGTIGARLEALQKEAAGLLEVQTMIESLPGESEAVANAQDPGRPTGRETAHDA